MGGGDAARAAARRARRRPSHDLHRPARRARSPASCSPTPTSSSIRPSTRSSGSCRSSRCSPAPRSSSPTIQGAAKSSPRRAAASSSPATPRPCSRRSTTSSPRPRTGARLPRKPRSRIRATCATDVGLRTTGRGVHEIWCQHDDRASVSSFPSTTAAHDLAETLASIAAQADGRPMEIIVVEDGSQDGSAALLRSLGVGLPADRDRRAAAAGPRRR